MSVIIDYSQISLAAVLVQQHEQGFEVSEGFFRHVIVDSLRSVVRRFRVDFGTEVIIARDARGLYWRDEVFPFYKWKRRQEKSEHMKEMSRICRVIGDELAEHMPYKFIEVPRAEADDVIAVIAKYKAQRGEKVLVVSEDEDFIQLIQYGVCIWKPRKKEMLVFRDCHPPNTIFQF